MFLIHYQINKPAGFVIGRECDNRLGKEIM
jgi:hypothetical protein